MTNTPQHIEGVQFLLMGQQGALGRYSLHFHLCGDQKGRSVVRKNLIMNSKQRCVVIHATFNATVDSNVAYNTSGQYLYSTVLDSTVLYCTVVYYTVLPRFAQYACYTAGYCTASPSTVCAAPDWWNVPAGHCFMIEEGGETGKHVRQQPGAAPRWP